MLIEHDRVTCGRLFDVSPSACRITRRSVIARACSTERADSRGYDLYTELLGPSRSRPAWFFRTGLADSDPGAERTTDVDL